MSDKALLTAAQALELATTDKVAEAVEWILERVRVTASDESKREAERRYVDITQYGFGSGDMYGVVELEKVDGVRGEIVKKLVALGYRCEIVVEMYQFPLIYLRIHW